MLRILKSYELEHLAGHLQKVRRERLPANPLAPELFVVQNHGVAQWLRLRLGREEGIAANLEFEFPAERVWAMARTLYRGIPELLPSDKGPMSWEIYELLSTAGRSLPAPLENYVASGRADTLELRRWKLARRIADVFDQYLVYRPGMILEWEEGSREDSRRAERWQAWLWRKLCGRWAGRYGEEPWLHRARLHNRLEMAITDGKLEGSDVPERISVFGVTAMPPPVARLLVRCADICEVTFYQCRPGDGEGSMLADSWDRSGRAFMGLLEDLASEYRPGAEIRNLTPPDSGTDRHLLSSIQQAIRPGPDPDPAGGNWDGSLQVHACHSAHREIQVLRDQLLALLEDHPELGPSDILVMNPDMEEYAPLIDSVFGVTEEGQPELPYTIVGGNDGSGTVSEAFLALLDLLAGRFQASRVLDFLELEAVRARFDLTDDQLDRIERWVRDNRIRWGIDASFKRDLDLPASSANTWSSGIRRMMLGYAMEAEENRLHEGIWPYEGIGQTDDALLLGRVSELLHELFGLRRYCGEPHAAGEWSQRLQEALRYFMDDGDGRTADWFRVSALLQKMGREGAAADVHRPVPYELVADWIGDGLRQGTPSGYPFGGITFSSMIPLRNIPFRVICLTGMNDGAFPRSRRSPGFDLMRLDPRPGDRSRLEEDRQIMLEALGSARDGLYISYVGQSNRQDSRYPPSVLVSELVDFAGKVCGISHEEAEGKTVMHRLQPFSPAYYREGELFSYSARFRDIAAKLGSQPVRRPPFLPDPLPPPEGEEDPIPLSSLVNFIRNPSRHLLQNRLGLYLHDRTREENDREPFELDGLERFRIRSELLEAFRGDEDLSGRERVLAATDRLPQGWAGETELREARREVLRFGERLQSLGDAETVESIAVEVNTGAGEVRGLIDRLTAGGILHYRFSRLKPSDLAELWVYHLALQCAGGAPARESRIVSRGEEDRPEVHHLPEMEAAAARSRLATLCGWYRLGSRQPLPFFQNTSFAYAEERLLKEKSGEEALRKARKSWKNKWKDFGLDGDDPYNHRLYAHGDALASEGFADYALTFWEPVLESLESLE